MRVWAAKEWQSKTRGCLAAVDWAGQERRLSEFKFLAAEVHMSGKTIGDLGCTAQRHTGWGRSH